MKLIILGNELKQSGEQQHSADCFCGDREHLKQILFNLLDNAIKITPKGGQVTLRVWRELDVAVFQVEDTGRGIPKHHLNLMFQTFQQLEKVYHRTYKGTGLGLALTKQLVELHGGRIEVDSIEGSGSIFTVWLPNQSNKELNSIGNSHSGTVFTQCSAASTAKNRYLRII